MTIVRVRGVVNGQQVEVDVVGDVADALTADMRLFGYSVSVRETPAALCPDRPDGRRVHVRWRCDRP